MCYQRDAWGSGSPVCGAVAISLSLRGEKLTAEMALPAGVGDEFVWRDQRRELPPGRMNLTI